MSPKPQNPRVVKRINDLNCTAPCADISLESDPAFKKMNHLFARFKIFHFNQSLGLAYKGAAGIGNCSFHQSVLKTGVYLLRLLHLFISAIILMKTERSYYECVSKLVFGK